MAGKNREPKTSLFGFQTDITQLSYVPKKNKNILVMSIMHHYATTSEAMGEKKLPEIISFYNFTKTGVDVVDKLSATCVEKFTEMASDNLFSLLNTAAINSLVMIYRENNQDFKLARRLLIKKLDLELIKDYISQRKINPKVPRYIRQRINNFAQDNPAVTPTKVPKVTGKKSQDRK